MRIMEGEEAAGAILVLHFKTGGDTILQRVYNLAHYEILAGRMLQPVCGVCLDIIIRFLQRKKMKSVGKNWRLLPCIIVALQNAIAKLEQMLASPIPEEVFDREPEPPVARHLARVKLNLAALTKVAQRNSKSARDRSRRARKEREEAIDRTKIIVQAAALMEERQAEAAAKAEMRAEVKAEVKAEEKEEEEPALLPTTPI